MQDYEQDPAYMEWLQSQDQEMLDNIQSMMRYKDNVYEYYLEEVKK